MVYTLVSLISVWDVHRFCLGCSVWSLAIGARRPLFAEAFRQDFEDSVFTACRAPSFQDVQHSIVNMLPILIEVNAANGYCVFPNRKFKVKAMFDRWIEQNATH
jgi:hypothetical protein